MIATLRLVVMMTALLAVPLTLDAQESTREEQAAAANLALGVAYLKQGNLPVAQEKLQKAVKQNPRDPSIHSTLALLHERLGDLRAADGSYRTALRLAPRNPDIVNNYAVYLCKSGRHKDGVKRFQQVANNRLYRTPEVAYTNAGVCLRNAQRYEEAERSLRRATALRPGHAEAAFQLSDLLFDRGRTEDARRQIESFLASHNPTADLLLLAVRIGRASGDRLAAERYARKLRMEFPDSAQTRALAALPANPG
jgi:type IV pilus assembly protein PilF